MLIKIIKASMPVILLVSSVAHAFKTDTHVWVGQQVINDIEDDGMLSFKIDNREVKIGINSAVRAAILNNKSDYLMGNIGPDATPDVVVGQTVIHPGVKDNQGKNIGWQTNDWLTHLLSKSSYSDSAKAFVYGYLGHAAADVFAHTYVNQYAGDIFNLKDETLVEQRHFVLESYIAKYTPELKNYRGQAIGSPWQQITIGDQYANFVRNSLIYNDKVQSEYRKVPTAHHLVAYYKFRQGINDLAEDGVWHNIDVAVAKIAASYFGIKLDADEAGKIVDETQGVIDELNRNVDNVQVLTNKVYTRLSKYDDKVFSNLSSSVNKMRDAEQSLLAKHQEFRRAILNKESQWRNTLGCPKKWRDPAGYYTCKELNRAIDRLNNSLLQAVNDIESDAFNLRNDLIQKTIEVRTESKKAVDSINKIANAWIDLHQVIGADVSPVQSVLRGWRADIDLAMTAYVKAASQSMVNTMDPNKSAIEPITTWFDCYHMQIIGIPSTISNCEFRDSLVQLKESVENIILIIDEATSLGSVVGLPSTADLIKLRDQLIDKLVNELKQEVSNKIVDILPTAVREIIVLLDAKVNDSLLNQTFTKQESVGSAKGLVMIPDMAERVKAEMSLTSSGTFNPDKYAVAYNAVVLAKLSLLDRYEFEKLALAAGSSDYYKYMFNIDNLVAQAFGNIDGNHQWMVTPPPIPNSLNIYPKIDYSYASDLGFIPWKGDMRDKLFRKLFIGPLSPGIDLPSSLGKPQLIATDYPYQVCAAYPYPNDIKDKTCTAILLIPIISGLLN